MRVNVLGDPRRARGGPSFAEPAAHPAHLLGRGLRIRHRRSTHRRRRACAGDAVRGEQSGAEYLGVQAYLGRASTSFAHARSTTSDRVKVDAFVVSALAKRIAEAELAAVGQSRSATWTRARDFTDVRDVVRAYRRLAELGVGGEVYNVCSGKARTIAELFSILIDLSEGEDRGEGGSGFVPSSGCASVLGDNAKIEALTSWHPEVPS